MVLAVVVALVVAAAVPTVAQEPEARGIDRVCPAPGTSVDDTAEAFPDAGDIHGTAIDCAAGYGIVSGFDDGTVRPSRPITRGQMATFVAAWLQVATGTVLPEPEELPFPDIEDSVHVGSIAAVTEAGIVGGLADGTFGPQQTLTRGQFTRAVVNAISYADVFAVGGPLPPLSDEVTFTDVSGTTFETTILSLAGVGVVLGTGDGAFQPQAAVTRGQLTTFLMRAADYLDRHQRWKPTALSLAVLVADLQVVASADDPTTDDGTTDTVSPEGTATLSISAFNGTLAYALDLSQAPGPYGVEGASIHLGDPETGGPLAIDLADAEALEAATGGVVTDVVLEADSEVRFADLLQSPQDAYVQVVTDAGVLRGRLGPPPG